MIYLETDRLLLRGWRDDDLEPFAAINADANVMAFYPAPLTRAQSDSLAARIRQSLDEDGFGLYAVELQGNFVGYVGFARAEFAAPFTPAMEIGWRLAFPAWGHGYATEAARACLAHGFTDLGFEEVVSFCARGNKRSIAVMERIDMVRDPEGDFEHPLLPAGHPLRPHVLYRA